MLGHQHVHSLQDAIAEPLEERVGDKRSDTCHVLVKGMDQHKEGPHVSFALPTYADVLKKSYVAETPHHWKSTTRKDILAREAHSLERIQ